MHTNVYGAPQLQWPSIKRTTQLPLPGAGGPQNQPGPLLLRHTMLAERPVRVEVYSYAVGVPGHRTEPPTGSQVGGHPIGLGK
jgi:hypothetical protein